MAEMTKHEFIHRLSEEQRLGVIWDWLQRLQMADQHLGGTYHALQERVTKVESKATGKDG